MRGDKRQSWKSCSMTVTSLDSGAHLFPSHLYNHEEKKGGGSKYVVKKKNEKRELTDETFSRRRKMWKQ